MRVCTRCGNVATGQQRYCTRCVAPLDPPEPPDGQAAPWWADDPHWGGPEPPGDWLAGGEAETSVLPLLIGDPAPDSGPGQASHGGRLYYPSADPRHAPAGRRAQMASAILAAVIAAAGALTAWAAFGQQHQTASPGARLSSQSTAASRRGQPAARPAPRRPDSGFPVLLAPGLERSPAASRVDGLLAAYFTAINALNFRQYAGTFLPSVRHQLSGAAFTTRYRLTRDYNASLAGIAPAPGHRLAVTVTFTSTQPARPSAQVTGCTYWAVTLFVSRLGPGFLIGAPPAGYQPYHHACD